MSNYFSILRNIAEQRISEAMENGSFDNLPGKGKPLQLDDDSHLPPEQRMAYRILKNSGYVDPEVEERREIANIRDMLDQCTDESTRYRQIQKLNALVTKVNEKRRSPVYLEAEQAYYRKVVERVQVRKPSGKKDDS
jgi:hypothetical protein